ncbi:MAG TPA: CPBP family intramembrane glutamic endopeptidase [Terriglobia bacterium]|nr:CPBP family intramembrane glutamic endopeptidase [Terriglobia bacterium]
MTDHSAPASDSAELNAGRPRRLLEAVLAVAVWMALGMAFHLDANAYLLLGIPITVVFQVGVRRAPLQALWVRSAPPLRLDLPTAAFAVVLAVRPAYGLFRVLQSHPDWIVIGWWTAALGGALACAYALRSFNRVTAWATLGCLATAGLIGVAVMAAGAYTQDIPLRQPVDMAVLGAKWISAYLPMTFVMEEVFFRGALDAHLHHPGESKGILTALCTSVLWGAWHYPVVAHAASLPALLLQLIGVQVLVGVPLSLWWRKCGNLFATGLTHAVIDTVRNILFSGL